MNIQLRLTLGLIVFYLAVPSSLAAQQTGSGQVLGTFIFNDTAYNFEFTKYSPSIYSFVINRLEFKENSTNEPADSIQPTDSTKTNKPATAPNSVKRFSTFNPEIFRNIFTSQMKGLFHQTDSVALNDKATEVYATIGARLEFLEDEPVTGYLVLRKGVFNSYLLYNRSNYYDGQLGKLILKHQVHLIKVEVMEGAIKNIEVFVIDPTRSDPLSSIPTQVLSFKNMHPISISAKFDKEKFANTFLYAKETGGERGITRYLRLSDILDLRIVYTVDKEDYSPDNGTFQIGPDNAIVELKKIKRSRILDVAAYSDIVGVDDDVPNGLIQMEASVRINVNTKYKPLSFAKKRNRLLDQVNLYKENVRLISDSNTRNNRGEKPPSVLYFEVTPKFKKGKADTTGVERMTEPVSPSDSNSKNEGVNTGKAKKDSLARRKDIIKVINRKSPLNYINFNGGLTLKVVFSKLDENNRFINPDLVNQGKMASLELLRHQTVNIGIRHQFFRIFYPQLKFHWNVLDLGVNWSKAILGNKGDAKADSIPINSSQFVLGSSIRFKPDGRWGVSLGIDYIRWMLWSEDIKLSDNRGLIQPYLDAYLWTNPDSRLFFRFRWTHSRLSREHNFTQAQLGYTIDLFKKQ